MKKYRVKSETGKWIYDNSLSFGDLNFDKSTIGKYIDKKDKNGVDIYEGDVLRINDVDIEVSCIYGICLCYDILEEFSSWSTFFETSEVIGNIYDNPELLEGVNKTIESPQKFLNILKKIQIQEEENNEFA